MNDDIIIILEQLNIEITNKYVYFCLLFKFYHLKKPQYFDKRKNRFFNDKM